MRCKNGYTKDNKIISLIMVILFVIILAMANADIDISKSDIRIATGLQSSEINSTHKVTLEVNDSAKTIKYDSITNKDDVVGEYKLYGKSNMEINVSGVDATHLRYRFNEKNNWNYIELKLENDIDIDKEGNLTNMPYDVSHMPLMSNEEMWNNRNNVFKDSFSKEITTISTDIFKESNGYVEKGDYENQNGQTVSRWNPKTLFVENHDVSSYAPDYKEARKTWGYMTVPQDDYYTFKAVTDDGFYGNITVDGETKIIGDAFRVKWLYDQPQESEPIKLEQGKYYPVYFEYFNWGGAACYKILCSTNNDTEYEEVQSKGIIFYPSKSSSPTLDANNGFGGSKVIDMPSKAGQYTFQYELVDGSNDEECEGKESKSEGTFGKFVVEERFELSKDFPELKIEEELLENKLIKSVQIKKGDEFKINYKLKPKEISLEDLYGKNISGSPVDWFLVENIVLEDKLPEGLFTKIKVNENGVEKEIESDEINLSEKSFKYELKGDKYVAKEYIFTDVKVECRDNVADTVYFNKSGIVAYRDVSLNDKRISLEQKFSDEFKLTVISPVKIIHGVYEGIDKEIINTENEPFVSSKSSIVPMAAKIECGASMGSLKLKLTYETSIFGDIRICKLNEANKFEEIKSIKLNDSNEQDICLENIKENELIYVFYNAKLGNEDDRIYKNSIKEENFNEINAKLKSTGEMLDLF